MMEQTDQLMTQMEPDTTPLAQLATTAAALIDKALLESLGSVAALGRALARLTESAPAGALQTCADLPVCIQNLQFHDRLAQRLIEIRDLLAPPRVAAPSPTEPPGATVLRERLRAHDTVGCDATDRSALRPDDYGSLWMRAEEDTVELF